MCCKKWFVFVAYTTDPEKLIMVASTSDSHIQLRLPIGDDDIRSINMIIYIRDMLNAVTQYDIYFIDVLPDLITTNTLVDDLLIGNVTTINTHSMIQLLASGNLNTVGQVLTSLSQTLNGINRQNIETAVFSKSSNCLDELI